MNSARYGTPPAPPPISTGSLPSQRLPTQAPAYEAPACVQNAMMTKDKKPFTYTPGGIDLSQIKSQRMAKRLARNAQSEGATGQQQMNRPTAQQQSNGGTSPAAQLGATAMGMPFQVLPTGPPPPPPPQPNKAGGAPPPPPAPQSKLSPQSNGSAANTRKSPTPQNFEPPPLGFRPEIKIPPNPMAILKKVPPPQEKNNFWVEEYRKERSKSPMVGNDENDSNRSPPKDQQPETNQYSYNNSQQQSEYPVQQNQYRSPSPQPMRQEYAPQRAASPPRTPQQEQQRRIDSPQQSAHFSPQQSPAARQYQPPQFQYTPSTPQPQSPSVQRLPQQFTPPAQYQGPTSPQYHQQQQQQQLQQQQQQLLQQQQQQQMLQQQQQQQQQQQMLQQQQQQQQQMLQQQQQQQTVPWRSPRPSPHSIQNNVSRPREMQSPAPAESPKPQTQPQMQPQQQQQTSPAFLRSREIFTSPQKPQSPPAPQAFAQRDRQQDTQQQQQQPPRQPPANRWVPQQQQSQPQAEVQTLNRIKSPPPPSQASNGFGGSGNTTGLRLQINNTSNAKERIIPIQLEQSPTPTRTPSAAPGFGPQPFYTANQPQYSSVPSPPLAQGANSNGQNSPSYVVRSPNQFVDQGYNNYVGGEDPNRVTSPTPRIVQQTSTAGGVKTRIIPIALDGIPDGPLNPNNVRGPISQQPLVIQNDPRNQNSWGNGSSTPNQSKSFRILQKITDTTDDAGPEAKPIEPIDTGDQEPQLQRPTYARQMGPGQMNSPTIEQMKRMQLNEQQAYANRARNQGTPPVMKQPQPNRYINQRPVYSPEEQSQQYVHPSEQQVPEPKKYTGSAIPSRSFKILQAMTTPENAGAPARIIIHLPIVKFEK